MLVRAASVYQVEFDPKETKSGITPPTQATSLLATGEFGKE